MNTSTKKNSTKLTELLYICLTVLAFGLSVHYLGKVIFHAGLDHQAHMIAVITIGVLLIGCSFLWDLMPSNTSSLILGLIIAALIGLNMAGIHSLLIGSIVYLLEIAVGVFLCWLYKRAAGPTA